jgi:hypothetical protein
MVQTHTNRGRGCYLRSVRIAREKMFANMDLRVLNPKVENRDIFAITVFLRGARVNDSNKSHNL